MADMFALQQQPAIVFPLSISPLDCELAENAARPGCQQTAAPGPGGGHRRRRLQTQIGANVDDACPQSSFDTRDTAMRTSCGFQSSDAADPLLQGSCPSLECARALLPLLEDCAEHIAEFARHIGPEAAFYGALESSEMLNNCVEMDQSAAEIASVQVEFRAPTLQVAGQMIAEHQRMVSEMFLPLAETGDGEQLCFGNPDASGGDGTRCGGRRQLDSNESDDEIRRLKAELEKSRMATKAAIRRSVEKDQMIERYRIEIQTKDQIIEQHKKTIEKQAIEIAFHKKLNRLRQNAVTPQNVSDTTRRNQTSVGRRAQTVGSIDSAILRSARVGPDRSVKACAVHPCQLNDGICQNGGICVETVAEGGGAVPFECQCAANFGGDRCENDNCAVALVDRAPGTFEVLSGPCTLSADGRSVGRPTGYTQGETCTISIHGGGGVLGPCPVFQTIDYLGLRGRADRRDALTIISRDGRTEQFSGGSGPQCFGGTQCDVGFYGHGVCNGCPVGKALVAGDTILWAAGNDDPDFVNCSVPNYYADKAATRSMAGWELTFEPFVNPCGDWHLAPSGSSSCDHGTTAPQADCEDIVNKLATQTNHTFVAGMQVGFSVSACHGAAFHGAAFPYPDGPRTAGFCLSDEMPGFDSMCARCDAGLNGGNGQYGMEKCCEQCDALCDAVGRGCVHGGNGQCVCRGEGWAGVPIGCSVQQSHEGVWRAFYKAPPPPPFAYPDGPRTAGACLRDEMLGFDSMCARCEAGLSGGNGQYGMEKCCEQCDALCDAVGDDCVHGGNGQCVCPDDCPVDSMYSLICSDSK
eukprot:SAG22_NODE_1082_length_5646_cov_20.621597_2_plen_808_part_00